MKRLNYLLIFILFSCSTDAQKDWAALKVGGDGAKYKVTRNSFGIEQKGTQKKDTITEKIIVEFTRRIVDSDEDALFAELEIPKYETQSSKNQHGSKRGFPDKKIHFKLNKQGGNPQIWNTEPTTVEYISKSLSLTWTFLDIPNKRLKKGSSWVAKFSVYPFVGEKTVDFKFEVTGKIDTLGYNCFIVATSGDLLETLTSTLQIPKEISESDEFEGKVKVEYRFYIDSESGFLVFGKLNTNALMSFEFEGKSMFFKGIGTERIVLLPEEIAGLKKNINKFSPEERAEQKLNAERNLPPVEYDFGEKFKVVFPLEFHEDDIWENFYRGYASVRIDGKWRLVDSTGRLIPGFSSEKRIQKVNDYFSYSTKEGVGLRTLEGKEIWEPKYESIQGSAPGVFRVEKGGWFTFLNEKKEELLPFDDYMEYGLFFNNCAFKTESHRKGWKGAFFDKNISLPQGYKLTRAIEKDLVFGTKDDERFIFDCSGNLLFEKPIKSFNYIDERFLSVKFKGVENTVVYEMINGNSIEKIKMPAIDFGGYESNVAFYPFSEDGKKTGLFDRQFNVVLKPGDYEEMDCNSKGCYLKLPNKKYDYFTSEKGIVRLSQVDSLSFDRGLPFQTKKNKTVYLSDDLKPLFKEEKNTEYQPVLDFFNQTWIPGLFIKRKTSKLGEQNLVNSTGKILTSKSYYAIAEYTTLGEFIVVQNEDEKRGLIHVSGKEITSAPFDNIDKSRYENDKRFVVKKDGKYGVIDSTGEFLLPTDFDRISLNKHGMIWVKKNDKYGLVQYTGK